MDQQDHEVAHPGNSNNTSQAARRIQANFQFAMDKFILVDHVHGSIRFYTDEFLATYSPYGPTALLKWRRRPGTIDRKLRTVVRAASR
jgi:hypothetical protein